ncbi:MAG: TolC family protein [Pontiellaceae bacterium]|nr:TolC family protein [Pontiellaceae bacterium]MBN2786637.1 TolC family protein [Pontiellaceae bacterium]
MAKEVARAVGLAFVVVGFSAAHSMETRSMSRDECIAMALENNRMCRISDYDVRIAESMLRQAKSAYWPTLSASMMGGVMDEPLLYVYPASTMALPPAMGGMTIDVPKQEIELMDRAVLSAGLKLEYPLYTGGLRKSINEQAAFGVAAALEGARRTELEVVRDVDRAYYAAVLARRLEQIAGDTLKRMEATLELTKRMYEEGAGTVKKTDYLRNKSVVEMIRSIKSSLLPVRVNADTALVHLLGLPHGTRVEPFETELPVEFSSLSLGEMIEQAKASNPDLAQLRAGLGAADAFVRQARSGYKPKFGLFATYMHFENELDTGIMDEQNRDFIGVGIGGQLSLFEGFRTHAHVEEATLKFEKLKRQEELLLDGLALQVEQAHAAFEGACARKTSVGDGLQAAVENRELNIRAYQEELVETQDVIEAQFMEAFLDFSYQKTLYECVEAQAQLHCIVGVLPNLTEEIPE